MLLLSHDFNGAEDSKLMWAAMFIPEALYLFFKLAVQLIYNVGLFYNVELFPAVQQSDSIMYKSRGIVGYPF